MITMLMLMMIIFCDILLHRNEVLCYIDIGAYKSYFFFNIIQVSHDAPSKADITSRRWSRFRAMRSYTKCLMTWWCLTWKRFARYWPFVRGIYRLPLDSTQNITRSFDIFFDVRLKMVEQTVESPVICDVMTIMWRHCNHQALALNEPKHLAVLQKRRETFDHLYNHVTKCVVIHLYIYVFG